MKVGDQGELLTGLGNVYIAEYLGRPRGSSYHDFKCLNVLKAGSNPSSVGSVLAVPDTHISSGRAMWTPYNTPITLGSGQPMVAGAVGNIHAHVAGGGGIGSSAGGTPGGALHPFYLAKPGDVGFVRGYSGGMPDAHVRVLNTRPGSIEFEALAPWGRHAVGHIWDADIHTLITNRLSWEPVNVAPNPSQGLQFMYGPANSNIPPMVAIKVVDHSKCEVVVSSAMHKEFKYCRDHKCEV